MTTLLATEKGLDPRTLGQKEEGVLTDSTFYGVPEYVWPPYYLPKVDMNTITNEIGLIVAIQPYSDSTVRFSASSNSGTFDVDWGDGGAVESVVSGNYITHNYNYFSLSSQGPINLNSITDRLELVAHSYEEGELVAFYEMSDSSGLANGRYYHTINVTEDTFQVVEHRTSLIPLPLLSTETAYLSKYRQVHIKITSSGVLEAFDIQENTTTYPGSSYAGICYLYSKTIGLSSLTIQRDRPSQTGTYTLSFLEEVAIDNFSQVSFDNLFEGFYALRGTSGIVSPGVPTSYAGMFKSCQSIRGLPINLSLAYATSTAAMFEYCGTIRTIPYLQMPICERIDRMFAFTGIVYAHIRAPYSINFQQAFQEAKILRGAELVTGFRSNTSINLLSTFAGCNIQQASDIVISQTFSNTFLRGIFDYNKLLVRGRNVYASAEPPTYVGCFSLVEVPVSIGSDQTSSFRGCHSLEHVDYSGRIYDSKDYSEGHASFQDCKGLRSIRLLVQRYKGYKFENCINLVNVELIPGGDIVNSSYDNMFSGCSSLQEIPIKSFPRSSYSSMPSANFMYRYCSSISSIGPDINLGCTKETGLHNTGRDIFHHCYSLQKFTPRGFYGALNLGSTKLVAKALNDTYASLLPVTEGYVSQTLQIQKIQVEAMLVSIGSVSPDIGSPYANLKGSAITGHVGMLGAETLGAVSLTPQVIVSIDTQSLTKSNGGTIPLSGLQISTSNNLGTLSPEANVIYIRGIPGVDSSNELIALVKGYEFYK